MFDRMKKNIGVSFITIMSLMLCFFEVRAQDIAPQVIQPDLFTGAATYEFPIKLPPGRGQIQPQLSLQYHSYSKDPNSLVGYGWSLELGSIQRLPERDCDDVKNCYSIDYADGEIFSINFEGGSETLVLIEKDIDGSSIGPYGDLHLNPQRKADLYGPLVRNGAKVYLHIRDYSTKTAPKDEGWLVIDESGNRYWFGTDSSSREESEDCLIESDEESCKNEHWVSKWFLDKKQDPNGNTLDISYQEVILFPKRITYQDITVEFEVSYREDLGVGAYFPQTQLHNFDSEGEDLYRRDRPLVQTITINDSEGRLQKYSLGYSEGENSFTYLSKISQLGKTDAESLPDIEFEYTGLMTKLAESSQDYSASTELDSLKNDGFIGQHAQLIDMNGDGLVDKVIGYEEELSLYVYYNNGNDFVYVEGRSEWKEPDFIKDNWNQGIEGGGVYKLRGAVEGYFVPFCGSSFQLLHLMDINGDSLPDRVLWGSSEEEGVFYWVALNTGSGWGEVSEWSFPDKEDKNKTKGVKDDCSDPVFKKGETQLWYHNYEGGTSAEKGFLDMNGDGLVDWVAPDKDLGGFRVYYNKGYGFHTDYVLWKDPAKNSPGITYSSTTKGGEPVYDASIKDFNGDGYPDRLFRTELADGSYGFAVALNDQGKRWVIPDEGERQNGVDYFTFEDSSSTTPVLNGRTSYWRDFLDLNNDGYLDFVDQGESGFKVRYFKGLKKDSSGDYQAVFSEVTAFDDPLEDGDGFEAKGLIYKSDKISVQAKRSSSETYSYYALHTFFKDINGDGYIDRVSLSPRDADSGGKVYQVFFGQAETLTYSDSPSKWTNQNVSQPSGALSHVNDGKGLNQVVEYLPSAWPFRWDITNSSIPLNHRLLPANLHLAHKIYIQDYSLSGTDTEVEAIRNQGMRWTTYHYYGGNYLFRQASEDDGFFFSFNGFQNVTAETFKAAGETWDDVVETTYFFQAKGDVDPIVETDEGYFNENAYSHYSISGQIYQKLIKEAGIERSKETYGWCANWVTEAKCDLLLPEEGSLDDFDFHALKENDFKCHDDSCLIQLKSVTTVINEVAEDGSLSSRATKVSLDYDDYHNQTSKSFYEGSKVEEGSLSLVKTEISEYYLPSDFTLNLQIKNCPSVNTISDSTTTYRKKTFEYDESGNLNKEISYVDITGSKKLEQSLTYYENGNLQTLTFQDGLTKFFTYDDNNLFIKETSWWLPSGEELKTITEFDRFTGQPKLEKNKNNVGEKTEYDSFGRILAKSKIDVHGTEWAIEEYDYDYPEVSIGDSYRGKVLKAQLTVFQDKEVVNYDADLTKTIYSDAFGRKLQECTLSERGDFRQKQYRYQNNYRTNLETYSIFVDSCSFQSKVASESSYLLQSKDALGRPVSVEFSSEGDEYSPQKGFYFSYSSNDDGHLVETKTQGDLKSTKVYDSRKLIVQTLDELNHSLEFFYDASGDLEKVTSDTTELVYLERNLLGQKTKSWDSNLGDWRYIYDEKGRLDEQIDGSGHTIKHNYDSVSRLSKKQIYQGEAIEANLEKSIVYTYDSGDSDEDVYAGELYKVEEYDESGSKSRETIFGYDSSYRQNSQIILIIPDLGEFKKEVNYSNRGLIQKVSYLDQEEFHYQYNLFNQVSKICSDKDCDKSSGYVYYEVAKDGFNEHGFIEKETFGNGVTHEFDYYSESNRLKAKKIANGDTIFSYREYEYDFRSNITALQDLSGLDSIHTFPQLKYDSLNRLQSYQYVAGKSGEADYATNTFSYDAYGNLLENSKVYGSNVYEYKSSRLHAVTGIGDRSFEYDDSGNLVSDGERSLRYNAENQLVKVVMSNGYEVEYDYNYKGERVKKIASLKEVETGVETSTYYIGNEIEVKNGNLVLYLFVRGEKIASKGLGSVTDILTKSSTSWTQAFQYSFFIFFAFLSLGFLCLYVKPLPIKIRTQSLDFIYSRMNLWKWGGQFKSGINGVKDGLEEAIHSFHCKTGLKVVSLLLIIFQFSILFSKPVFAASSSVEMVPATYLHYYHKDHLGSDHIVSEGSKEGNVYNGITFSQGDILQKIEYFPFGQVASVLNPSLNIDPSYTGQSFDVQTGLYFYKSRYYDPKLARFIQPDTMVPDPNNLQSYNRYSYVENNPLKYNDPTGHVKKGFWKKVGWAYLGITIISAAIAATIVTAGTSSFLFAASYGALVGSVSASINGTVSAIVNNGDVAKGFGMGALIGAGSGAVSGLTNAGLSSLSANSNLFFYFMRIGIVGSIKGAGEGFAYGYMGGKGAWNDIKAMMGKGAYNGFFTSMFGEGLAAITSVFAGIDPVDNMLLYNGMSNGFTFGINQLTWIDQSIKNKRSYNQKSSLFGDQNYGSSIDMSGLSYSHDSSNEEVQKDLNVKLTIN